jgi:hypothetical protein
MEKRVLTLKLAVEQNTKLLERLERRVGDLSLSVNDLRVEMLQGHTALRKEVGQHLAELQKSFDRKFLWLFSSYCAGLLTVLGFFGKYLLDQLIK